MAKTTSKKQSSVKQTENKRRNGQFAPGNKLGNRWAKGTSGNPAGRPKARTLSEHLRDRLKEQFPGKSSATYGRMVAEALVTEAIDGNMQAIREIFDRVEGKPKQTIDVNVEERKREMVEDAIAALIEQAQVSREEAIEQLTAIAPEMSPWIH
jgi:Family of unknown function (DUF5681)